MPNNRHIVHLIRTGKSFDLGKMFRIVVDGTRLHLEWCRPDCLGNPAWIAVERGDVPQETALKILALEIIDLLGRPSWIPFPQPERELSIKGNPRIIEISCRARPDLPRHPNKSTIRIVHHEEEMIRDAAVFHSSLIEILTQDALKQPSWDYCSTAHDYRHDRKGIQMLEHIIECYITLIGARFGEKDHRQELYGAIIVPDSIYTPCQCGRTHSETDFETLVGCRLCGNVIGPAR